MRLHSSQIAWKTKVGVWVKGTRLERVMLWQKRPLLGRQAKFRANGTRASMGEEAKPIEGAKCLIGCPPFLEGSLFSFSQQLRKAHPFNPRFFYFKNLPLKPFFFSSASTHFFYLLPFFKGEGRLLLFVEKDDDDDGIQRSSVRHESLEPAR